MAALAAVAAAVGVQQAVRVPPVKDIDVAIPGLPRHFDGYSLLHLTDLHISRLYPGSWARAVVDRSWILRQATADKDSRILIDGIGRALNEAGVPTRRVTVSVATLNTSHRGIALD